MFQLLKKKTGRLTRVLRYIKRSREKGHIRPVHVSGAELKDRSNYYGGIVEDFVREMNARAENFEADYPRNERLTDYEILSFNGDRMGKVLRKDGEIYRGIYRESADDFREMWKTGLLQTLSAHGWIPETEISGYYTDEYPIILKHRTVDMNASKLWSYNMVREAAIRISLIQNIARRAGFTLHDGHMNNVTFHEGKPVFTDIGSFVKDRGQTTVCNREIVFSGCYRCVFRQLGNFMLSRNQTYDESNNMIWMTPRYYDDLTEEYRLALRKFRAYHRFRSSAVIRKIIHRMFDCWDVRPEYVDVLFPSETGAAENPYPKDVERIAAALREAGIVPASAVDVGGTAGHMSERIYKEYGVKVTCCETDDTVCDRAYAHFVAEKIPGNVFAFHYLYGCDPDSRRSVIADLATCADITHNVFSVQQYRCDSLLNSLRKMAYRYVAVTYYPYRVASEKYIRRLTDEGAEDVQEFVRTFKEFFDVLLMKEFGYGQRDRGCGSVIRECADLPEAGDIEDKEDYCLLMVGRVR